jgi:hypothetical protein
MVVLSRPVQVPVGSVSQDWRKPLTNEKTRVYLHALHTLETAYAMFSVNLDEALGMRRYGRTPKAYQVLSVAPALCRRLARPLHSLLCAMLEHAKHFGTAPNLRSLDPENFQHSRSQRVACFSDLFSRILLTRKSQFLHKMSALSDLVDELDASFETTIEELCEDQSLHPERDWKLLASVHYDLNTCLREAVVLFKSFLHALPDGQLALFEFDLHERSFTTSPPSTVSARHLAHRRIAFLKGQ